MKELLTTELLWGITPWPFLCSLSMTESANDSIPRNPVNSHFIPSKIIADITVCCLIIEVLLASAFKPFIRIIPRRPVYVIVSVVIVNMIEPETVVICETMISLLMLGKFH